MTVDVILNPGGFSRDRMKGKWVVVIDVLRSSSTLITALHNGAKEIFLCDTPDEAKGKSKQFNRSSVLLCGERSGKKIKGFDLGNSPLEYTVDTVHGNILFFTSTNGSKMMIMASQSAETLIVGGFNNISAVVNRLIKEGCNCVFVCSGKNGQFSLEDGVCAGMLVDRIREASDTRWILTDEAFSSTLLYRHFKDNLVGLMHFVEHGIYLKKMGMESDLQCCAQLDMSRVIPVFKNSCLNSLKP